MRFVTSVDPEDAAEAVSDLRPSSTLVISVNLRADDDTRTMTKTVRDWLLRDRELRSQRPEQVYAKHVLTVTADDRTARSLKAESVFLLPEHSRCEAFTSLTSAVLLPLAVVFGWSTVRRVLAGAHDLDGHFVESCPRHNLPVF